MAILSLQRVEVGAVGSGVGQVNIVSTDDISTVTTAGYINIGFSGISWKNTDFVYIAYDYTPSTGGNKTVLFPTITNGVLKLNVPA